MPKRDWGNGFASGLIVAICAIALLFVTIGAVEKSGTSPPEQRAQCDTSGQQCPQKNDDSGYWRGVTKRFVSSEDTLAQWLMMVASLLAVGISGLAVYWVKRTFEITRDMAKDNREVAEAQTHAYLTIERVRISARSESYKLGEPRIIDCIIRNSGNSPAKDITVSIRAHVPESDYHMQCIVDDIESGGSRSASVLYMDSYFTDDDGRAQFAVTVRIIFVDVFAKLRTETFKMSATTVNPPDPANEIEFFRSPTNRMEKYGQVE